MLGVSDRLLRIGLHDITNPQVLFGRHLDGGYVRVVRRVERLEPLLLEGDVRSGQEAEAASGVLAAVGGGRDGVLRQADAAERVAEAVTRDRGPLAIGVDLDGRPRGRRRAVLDPASE